MVQLERRCGQDPSASAQGAFTAFMRAIPGRMHPTEEAMPVACCPTAAATAWPPARGWGGSHSGSLRTMRSGR
jgi:hypothetical protein